MPALKSVDLLILKSYLIVRMIFISEYIRLFRVFFFCCNGHQTLACCGQWLRKFTKQEMKSWDAINMVQLATFALDMQHKLTPSPIIHPTVQLFIVGPDDTTVHTVQQ